MYLCFCICICMFMYLCICDWWKWLDWRWISALLQVLLLPVKPWETHFRNSKLSKLFFELNSSSWVLYHCLALPCLDSELERAIFVLLIAGSGCFCCPSKLGKFFRAAQIHKYTISQIHKYKYKYTNTNTALLKCQKYQTYAIFLNSC